MLQYVSNVLRQFCKPVLERDKIIKSTAYSRSFNFVPFGRTKGSDRIQIQTYFKMISAVHRTELVVCFSSKDVLCIQKS